MMSGYRPAFSEAEGNLDWVISSEDWIGGEPIDPSEEWKISFGGRIYDKWYAALNSPQLPSKTHPAYPESGKNGGTESWRCKECHGWDYKGKDGAYGSGNHFTGIPGLRQIAGTDPEKIPEILTDETHGYTTEMIPEFAMEAVGIFLTRGQYDTDRYIDKASGKVDGDPKRGKIFYQNVCAACHGFDGKAINFLQGKEGDKGPGAYVGTVANSNPRELLHKILNGQPGQPMPALRILPFKDVINILAYAQQLPVK
jgi:mono/diheme cytochrome c family protein